MFTFKIIPDGGEPYELEAGSRDVLRWERGGRGRSVSRLRETMSFVDLYALAHVAAVRHGTFTGSLPEFEDGHDFETVATTDADEDGPAGDPTHPAP